MLMFTDRPGETLYRLVEDDIVRGRVKTFFSVVTETVAIATDADGVREEYSLYIDTRRLSPAQRQWLRGATPGGENRELPAYHMHFPTLPLAQAALESFHIFE
jgi:hypothetical protein